ncbi:GntR family transcriptional regulator [Pseudonocardia nantongensis]|uniref:GntR family transcriptional regulator n=1 Tax=Pseudonocardia nantongensis TaxID=1181885 RepID=UPI00397E5FA1
MEHGERGGGPRYGATDGKSDRVLAALRGDIVTGTFAQGERLTESSLCERYRVSRVPVREALRTLAVQGFVEVRPNQGASVAVVPGREADDLFAVRTTIEGLTAGHCARHVAAGDDTVVQRLYLIVAEGEDEMAGGELTRLPELNTRFHLTMAEGSGSTSLTALLHQISHRIEWIYAMNVSAQGARSWTEHRAITAAIAAGAPGDAARLAREHVANSRAGFHRHHSGAPADR